jgi:hypothetical protein
VMTGAELKPGEAVRLMFPDHARNAVIDGASAKPSPKPEADQKQRVAKSEQGSLF